VLYLVPNTNYYEVKEEKFDETIHTPFDIYSRAPFTRGLDEIKALPGLYARGGFNFEYSKQDKIIHAIELRKSDKTPSQKRSQLWPVRITKLYTSHYL